MSRKDRQIKDVDYCEIYDPVVASATAHFDSLDVTVYFEIPKDFAQHGKMIKLKYRLYVLKKQVRISFCPR